TDTATSAIYTLSLHDALPICPTMIPASSLWTSLIGRVTGAKRTGRPDFARGGPFVSGCGEVDRPVSRVGPRSRRQVLQDLPSNRSEEHTSELQSREKLVCRLL